MHYKIFFGVIGEKNAQGNILVPRVHINGNLSENDKFASYL